MENQRGIELHGGCTCADFFICGLWGIDAANADATQSFTITVTNTNDAPDITSNALEGATEDVAYSYAITTSDDDAGDTATITAPTKPAWLNFTDNGDGTATLTSTGRGATLWRTRAGPWVALQDGDFVILSDGDVVALDQTNPERACFVCLDERSMQPGDDQQVLIRKNLS